MTTVYPMPFFPANPRPPRPRLRGLGTLHVSAQWTANVRAIRAAVAAAREAAPGQRAPSAERLADEVEEIPDFGCGGFARLCAVHLRPLVFAATLRAVPISRGRGA